MFAVGGSDSDPVIGDRINDFHREFVKLDVLPGWCHFGTSVCLFSCCAAVVVCV